MTTPVVIDSTCLIGLERIGQLDILPALFEPVLIPPAVQREFGISLPWLGVVTPCDQGMVVALKMLVDEGEAEAIALAYESKNQMILDDRQARAVAKNMGPFFIGTVGILVRAKQKGVVSTIKPLLEALESNGFYLSEALKVEALHLVGE